MRWFPVILSTFLVACTSVRPARPPQENSSRPASVAWPELPDPARPAVKVLQGPPPRDLGVINGWHVLRYGTPEVVEPFIVSKGPLISSGGTLDHVVAQMQKGRTRVRSSITINGKLQEVETYGYSKAICVHQSSSKLKRGTIVLVGSFYSGNYGARQELDLARKMNEDGWDVVLSSAHPHLAVFQATKMETTLPQVASRLAHDLDKMIAWEAGAVDAVLSALERERKPATPRRPVVYIGISAGALVVPALATRHGSPDATILVCGSASVGELLFVTGLPGARPSIKLANGHSPTLCERRQLARLTRLAARLDPEKLASCFQGKPVLLVTAGQDVVVPTRLQRDLDHALGKPERWHRWGGHAWTICRLSAQWSRLREWLREATETPDSCS